MADLTSRQRDILLMIESWMAREGRPPTRADIAAAFGFRSPNAAEDHLRALARKGAIVLQDGTARGIRLVHNDSPRPARQMQSALPLLGRVAAGAPLLAVEHIERHIPVDPDCFKPRADYLLRIRGQSMRDLGMLDGDLLAVHRCDHARHGQVVVARVDDEVTVKTLWQTEHGIQLRAHNPEFAAIDIGKGQEFSIEGLAVGVLRCF